LCSNVASFNIALGGYRAVFMSKLMLLSIMIATIALPARAARRKNPRVGFRKMVVHMLVFEALYLFALRFLYGRI
jgi:hypothetical protein